MSYDIRPGKQTERRIVFETLDAAHEAGIAVRNLPMVGMGGVRFIDFILANKLLGTSRFHSIEHDENIVPRCEFNKPFGRIKMYKGSSSDFISEVGFAEPTFVWFDYEQSLSLDMHNEIVDLTAAIKPGSFVLITLSGEMPERWAKIAKTRARKEAVDAELGQIVATLGAEDFDKSNFRFTAVRMIESFLKFGLAGRADGEWLPFLKLIYKDSVWMVTIGGFFGEPAEGRRIAAVLRRRCSYISPCLKGHSFQIEQFNITESERRLFDHAALPAARRSQARRRLEGLGFSRSTIKQYTQLMRFIPRYFESLI